MENQGFVLPPDYSVFVDSDLESTNKDKFKEILTTIIQNNIFHILKKINTKYNCFFIDNK